VVAAVTPGKKSEVRGEAVIGEYPILRAGGEPFEYKSCTNTKTPGTMEGGFMFVEVGPVADVMMNTSHDAGFILHCDDVAGNICLSLGRYCLPRHRMPCNFTSAGSKCVVMT